MPNNSCPVHFKGMKIPSRDIIVTVGGEQVESICDGSSNPIGADITQSI